MSSTSGAGASACDADGSSSSVRRGGLPDQGFHRGSLSDAVPHDFLVDIASWNLAGVSSRDALHILSRELRAPAAVVQEWPKMAPGWQFLAEGGIKVVVHQDVMMYRGVGIAYQDSIFHLCKKKKSSRGAWFLMLHKPSNRRLWIGSVHLQSSDCNDEYQRAFHDFLRELPPTTLPTVALGDYNTEFKWSTVEQGQVGVPNTRWNMLRDLAAGRGLLQCAPALEQARTPTWRPRRNNARGTHIDGGFLGRVAHGVLSVLEGSRHQVGTDHDMVQVTIRLADAGARRG